MDQGRKVKKSYVQEENPRREKCWGKRYSGTVLPPLPS